MGEERVEDAGGWAVAWRGVMRYAPLRKGDCHANHDGSCEPSAECVGFGRRADRAEPQRPVGVSTGGGADRAAQGRGVEGVLGAGLSAGARLPAGVVPAVLHGAGGDEGPADQDPLRRREVQLPRAGQRQAGGRVLRRLSALRGGCDRRRAARRPERTVRGRARLDGHLHRGAKGGLHGAQGLDPHPRHPARPHPGAHRRPLRALRHLG